MWNGEKLPVGNFEDYCKLYLGAEQHVYHRFSDRWEICVAPTDEQGFQQVGLATVLGQHSSWPECLERRSVPCVADGRHPRHLHREPAALRRSQRSDRNLYVCNECMRSWLTSASPKWFQNGCAWDA